MEEDKGLNWALDKIKKIFDEAAKKREASSKVSVDEAHKEFFTVTTSGGMHDEEN